MIGHKLAQAALAVVALSLACCNVGPNFVPPASDTTAAFWPKAAGTAAPAAKSSVAVADPVDPQWWTLFGDPELVSLEQRLAGGNLDLQIYTERLAQSRAQLGVAQADELPTLDGSASYTRERPSAKGVLSLFSGGSSGSSFASQGSVANGLATMPGAIPVSHTGSSSIPPFNLFQYGFDASWELDLWGHARREVEAAHADLQAAADQGRNTLISAEAELARDYVQLRGLQQRVSITQNDLTSFDATLHLTRERARAGLTTDLDVANSEAQLASARAELPQLYAQQAQMLNAISLLLGEEPGAVDAELTKADPIPPVPPRVPLGLPSELARRRPDIRSAEAQLHSATAEIGVAVADFYPKITLSGSIGIQALLAKNLGNWGARQYGFGPSITLPLFEGGRLRATLELRKAEQREAAVNYRKTVLQALSDVSNALVAYTQDQARRDDLILAVQAGQQAVVLARQRYRQGISSFIEVLDAQRTELQAEEQLTDSTATVSTDMVALYKAIGGGWDDTAADAQLAAK